MININGYELIADAIMKSGSKIAQAIENNNSGKMIPPCLKSGGLGDSTGQGELLPIVRKFLKRGETRK